jgi:hypothetical protein
VGGLKFYSRILFSQREEEGGEGEGEERRRRKSVNLHCYFEKRKK